MNKNRRSWNILLLALLLLLAACSGNAGTAGNGSNGSEAGETGSGTADAEPVTLKWIMGGPGKQRDSDKVWALFNERLQEYLPNTKVEFEVIPFGEFKERWQLISASQEQADLVWTGFVLSLADEVRKGAYLPLDELVEAEAPGILDVIPDWVLDMTRVDGELYAIPNYQQMTETRIGMRTPTALADAYLDRDKAEQVFLAREGRPLDQASYDVLTEYFSKIKEAGKIQKGISDAIWPNINAGVKIASPFVVPVDDKTYTVQLLDELPEKILEQQMQRQWQEMGFIREDILSNTNRRQDEGKEDGYIAWFHENFKGQSEKETANAGFPIDVIPLEEKFYISRLDSATNTAIARQSEHPERAMQFLELMHTEKGKDLYRLLVHGIEGEHYTVVNDNRIELTDFGQKPDSAQHPYSMPKWAVGNTFMAYETQLDPEGWNDYILDVHDQAVVHPLVGFKPDLQEVRTEIAQISAISTEYKLYEFSPRPLEEMRTEKLERIKQAGGDKVKRVLQEQIDAYLQEKGVEKQE
ncbi:ABC transporter substrate-binding protein [Paenibacillus sp. IB182496]|uniref:ABC transporter substrate-binding protein n=1 Tax=Paenibacillus sabuli TaxID=2772509 RepID=A0A927BV60_9BACL|nr:ABC transporter substrate-binding protein [Paenibacillus sabuli]MBD2847421.1 ABC transporter substrate-binding protein [Paenibacillus sabuli]